MRIIAAALLLIWACAAQAIGEDDNLQKQLLEEVRRLSAQVVQLRQELHEVKQTQRSNQVQSDTLQKQIAHLQQGGQSQAGALVYESLDEEGTQHALVDLSEQQQASLTDLSDSHVLSNPWWRNIQIWGFGAAGYYDTGSGGTREHGSFEIKEATLFVEADVWENTSFMIELQTNRLGKDDDKFARTGEVYIHFRDVLETDNSAVGLKIGRFDLPFGEEYLWQDANDNPLITNSASYAYGWDEGLLAYGHWRELNWVAAVSDGSDARSRDENSDKAVNLKLYGEPLSGLYLSASYMYNGDNIKSAIEFGGSHFQPVVDSAAGSSTSEEVNSDLFEVNAKYQFSLAELPAYVSLTAGLANQDDPDSHFDRDFRWFTVEPYLRISNSLYTVLRYSEIGTYDDDEGFHFDGKTFAGGNSAFGFDTERFRRLGIGLGWQFNPRTTAKIEIGKDWFDLIDGSTREKDDNRNFVGLEMAVGF